jgi:hypothetical protein
MPDDTASAWFGTGLARQLTRVLESMVGEATRKRSPSGRALTSTSVLKRSAFWAGERPRQTSPLLFSYPKTRWHYLSKSATWNWTGRRTTSVDAIASDTHAIAQCLAVADSAGARKFAIGTPILDIHVQAHLPVFPHQFHGEHLFCARRS